VKKLLVFLTLFFCPILKAETHFETGPTFLIWEGLTAEFTNGQAYLITQSLPKNFEIGVIGVTSQVYSYYGYPCSIDLHCYSIIPQNFALKLGKNFEYKNWEFGAGIAYWKDRSIIFPQKQTFELTIGYRLTERSEIRFRHYSNGYQTEPNVGLNVITLDLEF